MKLSGKLDYLEMPATGGTLDRLKAFYSAAFAWSFTDYGPTYSAFAEGLDEGFQADAAEAPSKPLPVLYSRDLEATLDAVENAGGTVVKPIFAFLAAAVSTLPIRPATRWRCGPNSQIVPSAALLLLPKQAFSPPFMGIVLFGCSANNAPHKRL